MKKPKKHFPKKIQVKSKKSALHIQSACQTQPPSKSLTATTQFGLFRLLPAFIKRNRTTFRTYKILDNIAWLFLDNILRMGVGLLIGVWVARYLGPEQFGQLNFAMAFVGIFGAVAGLGLNGIVVRDIVREPETANITLGTAFVLQASGGVFAVALIIGTMAWLRPDDTLTKTLVAIFGLGLIFKSTEVVKYWFESQVQSRYTVWIETVSLSSWLVLKLPWSCRRLR